MAAARQIAKTHAMKWIALATIVLVGSAAGGTARATASEPQIVGDLPSQALLVAGKRDTILVGLDGHVHGRIVGVQPAWTATGPRNEPFQILARALPDHTFVVDRARRWYVLETSGRVRLLRAPRLRLTDGTVVTAHGTGVTVVRSGHAVYGVQRLAGPLAITPSVAVDLDTGARWKLSSECYAVGISSGRLLEICGPSGFAGTVSLLSVAQNGTRTTLSELPRGLYVGSAFISPGGKDVVAMFSPGCGGAYAFLVPTDGGPARPLTGESNWTLDAPHSSLLGWTSDGRIVASVQASRAIDVDPKPGIYVIDPHTFARTLVYPGVEAWAFWAETS